MAVPASKTSANTLYLVCPSIRNSTYEFNKAEKLNTLLLEALLTTGQLTKGIEYDFDFDHQFIETEKYDAKTTYRCILTNDHSSSVREIVEFYNRRGGKERIFDEMNNGFGWSHLPKSFMSQNAAFLLLTALIYNFYKYILSKLKVSDFGLKPTSRIKTFVFKFVSVAAKWIKAAKQNVGASA